MRLIDADALGIGKCNPDVFENKGYASGWNAAIDLINSAPTIDAVPVVRCRECKCYPKDFDEDSWNWCCGIGDDTKPNDFCSYGQRR